MTSLVTYSLRRIGIVRSGITMRQDAPNQGSEGAPEAWIDIELQYAEALSGITAGREIILVTWLDQAHRDVLQLHPRGDPSNALAGVFATRSPDRPNPIGLHRVHVLEIAEPMRLRVKPLEAIDGTPVIDIKPALDGSIDC